MNDFKTKIIKLQQNMPNKKKQHYQMMPKELKQRTKTRSTDATKIHKYIQWYGRAVVQS
jgi:hypothetical protein